MIMPAAFTMPEVRFTLPRVIMVVTPTPMKPEFPDAGCLFKAEHLPPLHLSLEVTRGQFSDMLRMLEAKYLKDTRLAVRWRQSGIWHQNILAPAAAVTRRCR